jgi:hypothetical protein
MDAMSNDVTPDQTRPGSAEVAERSSASRRQLAVAPDIPAGITRPSVRTLEGNRMLVESEGPGRTVAKDRWLRGIGL